MNFVVRPEFETRNDNVNLIGYKVSLAGKAYMLYYDKKQLREVYFYISPEYFMSCRSDMKTISHYYTTSTAAGSDIVKRYENGILNRVYEDNRATGISTCIVDGIERVYTTTYGEVNVNQAKLYDDLVDFLVKFSSLGLYKHFSPKEPVEHTDSNI